MERAMTQNKEQRPSLFWDFFGIFQCKSSHVITRWIQKARMGVNCVHDTVTFVPDNGNECFIPQKKCKKPKCIWEFFEIFTSQPRYVGKPKTNEPNYPLWNTFVTFAANISRTGRNIKKYLITKHDPQTIANKKVPLRFPPKPTPLALKSFDTNPKLNLLFHHVVHTTFPYGQAVHNSSINSLHT